MSVCRSYGHPQPEVAEIDKCCFAFHVNVLQGLQSPGVDLHLYVPFRLDFWRYLPKGRGRDANKKEHTLWKNMNLIALSCQTIGIIV